MTEELNYAKVSPESLGQGLGFTHLQAEYLTGGHGSEGRVRTQSLAVQNIIIILILLLVQILLPEPCP